MAVPSSVPLSLLPTLHPSGLTAGLSFTPKPTFSFGDYVRSMLRKTTPAKQQRKKKRRLWDEPARGEERPVERKEGERKAGGRLGLQWEGERHIDPSRRERRMEEEEEEDGEEDRRERKEEERRRRRRREEDERR
eukprot:Sspe_Gene.99651::Locus_73366_Transcript_1_1_Confidence_1.000_Length_463::g.99651::m.99651